MTLKKNTTLLLLLLITSIDAKIAIYSLNDGKLSLAEKNHPMQQKIYKWIEAYNQTSFYKIISANCYFIQKKEINSSLQFIYKHEKIIESKLIEENLEVFNNFNSAKAHYYIVREENFWHRLSLKTIRVSKDSNFVWVAYAIDIEKG